MTDTRSASLEFGPEVPTGSRAGPAAPANAQRYGNVAVVLHWLIGLLLLVQIAFGFLLDTIAPRGTPSRAVVINLHKSFGIVLGVLILIRLGWRLAHRPPPMVVTMAAWQRQAALFGHRTLYTCMLVMPLAGYVASNFSKHGVRFFGVMLPPWGGDLPPVYAFLTGLHIAMAWLLCLLIAGHIALAFKHDFYDHDEVLRRMWPWKRS